MKVTSSKTIVRVLLTACATLSIGACSGTKAVAPEADALLQEYRASCLRHGLAIDTEKHVDCVIALHEARQKQQARLRSVVAPAQVAPETDTSPAP